MGTSEVQVVLELVLWISTGYFETVVGTALQSGDK
jgi:hypothetical protein